MLLAFWSTATLAQQTGWPWPVSALPRGESDKLTGDGLCVQTAADGVCDTQAHPGSDDIQVIAVGCGAPGWDCIGPGQNGVLDSIPEGDDVDIGLYINTGENGIRETPALGDDTTENEIFLGNGMKERVCVAPGGDGVLGYHPVPQFMTNTLGELAADGDFHTGVDVVGEAGHACLAPFAGTTYVRPGGGEYGFVRITPDDPYLYPDISCVEYWHCDWDTNDGGLPASVAAGGVAGRLVPWTSPGGYPHVHINAYKASSDGEPNPLCYLSPVPQYAEGQPQIIQESIAGGPDLPLIMLFADGNTSPLVWHKHLKPTDDGAYIISGEDAPDCDVVASVGSVSGGTHLGGYSGDADRVRLLPYEAGFQISSDADPPKDTWASTTFKMDSVPGFHTPPSYAKPALLFATGSQAYSRHFIIFTNCDGSTNYDELANVTENCWPTGQKDANDKWLVPQGEYTITVSVADYEGQSASASVNVEVDRGQKEQPARGQ